MTFSGNPTWWDRFTRASIWLETRRDVTGEKAVSCSLDEDMTWQVKSMTLSGNPTWRYRWTRSCTWIETRCDVTGPLFWMKTWHDRCNYWLSVEAWRDVTGGQGPPFKENTTWRERWKRYVLQFRWRRDLTGGQGPPFGGKHHVTWQVKKLCPSFLMKMWHYRWNSWLSVETWRDVIGGYGPVHGWKTMWCERWKSCVLHFEWRCDVTGETR